MEANLSISNSKKNVPKAFLAALFIILFHEMVIFPHLLFPKIRAYTENTELSVWTYKNEAISRGGIQAEVLFIGDSALLMGMNAKSFQEQTGTSAYNAAFGGMQTPGHYFLLKRYLAKNPKPKLIFYAPSPFLVNDRIEDEFTYRFVAWFAGPYEMASLFGDLVRLGPRGAGPAGLFFQKCFLPSFVYRYDLQRVIDFLFHSKKGQENAYREIADSLENNRGFVNRYRRTWGNNPRISEGAVAAHYRSNPDDAVLFRFRPSEMNLRYLNKFLQLCADERIAVSILLGPYPESLYAMREKIGYQKRFVDLIASVMAQFKNVTAFEPFVWKYENNHFADFIHLNAAGAELFTEAFARDFLRRKTRLLPGKE